MTGQGPLAGVRILEAGGIGAGPFCGLLLADMGADLVRVERPGGSVGGDTFTRGKQWVGLDLKSADDLGVMLELADHADVLLEGFRPGVAERLGFGPEACLARNPRLVYARCTGWGQDGPMSDRAGHDINYIAISGVLGLVGRAGESPVPPLNLVGDFGGGGLSTAYGIVCALVERASSGVGQVVDGSMVEGSALLALMYYDMLAKGVFREERGTNALDGGAPYYDTYETADGGWFAIGPTEPQFYAELLRCLGLDSPDVPDRNDQSRWPELRALIGAAFRSRTRAEWEAVFADVDACATPVLSLSETFDHPQHVARSTFVRVGDSVLPGPAPRLSRTPGVVRGVEVPAMVDDVRDRWRLADKEEHQ